MAKVGLTMKRRKTNIVLIGFMGCGKTTLGKKISTRLGYKFIDTDKYIEKKENKNISKIFENDGEEYFRQLERNMVMELSEERKCVIATGGGIIKDAETMAYLKKSGIILYLKSTAEHIYRNVGNDKSRPLLQGGNKMEKIRTLMAERIPIYEKYAMVTVDVSRGTVSQTAKRIIEALGDRI